MLLNRLISWPRVKFVSMLAVALTLALILQRNSEAGEAAHFKLPIDSKLGHSGKVKFEFGHGGHFFEHGGHLGWGHVHSPIFHHPGSPPPTPPPPQSPPIGFNPSLPPGTTQFARYQMYDGPNIPSTPDNLLPIPLLSSSTNEGGPFNESINTSEGVTGNCLEMDYTADNTANAPGFFYPQWNPYNYAGNSNYLSPRGFAHEYAQDAATWQFNTYNRFSFWIKRPQNSAPIVISTGNAAGDYGNANVGTYCKSISACTTDPADSLDSDEFGGGHFYHTLTLANNNYWTHVILNTQPDHQRGINAPVGVLTHPTGESQYNYYDTFTRFYYEEDNPPSNFPENFKMDDFIFYQEPYPEDDANIFSVTSNYNPGNNELVLTWSHNWNDGTSNHYVYYSFQDIHQTGLSGATLAPNGIVAPPNSNGYDCMVYDTTALPLAGHSVVYMAIWDQASPANLFTEIMVPLTGLR